MRFKNFLAESYDGDLEELVEIVKKCRHNLELIVAKKQLPAWRGDDSEHHHVELPSRTELKYLVRGERLKMRRSAASADAALVFATNNWKGLPRRGYSNFGTLNRNHASETFNDVCWMVPFDDVKLFASAELDFNLWEQVPKKRKAHQLLTALRSICRYILDSDYYREHDNPIAAMVTHLAGEYAQSFKLFDGEMNHGITKALESEAGQPAALDFLQKLMDFEPELLRQSLLLDEQRDDIAQGKNTPPMRFSASRAITLANKLHEQLAEVRVITGGDIAGYLKNALSPEAFGVEAVTGYANLPQHTTTFSEFWFEGKYLSIDALDPDFLTSPEVRRLALQLLDLPGVRT